MPDIDKDIAKKYDLRTNAGKKNAEEDQITRNELKNFCFHLLVVGLVYGALDHFIDKYSIDPILTIDFITEEPGWVAVFIIHGLILWALISSFILIKRHLAALIVLTFIIFVAVAIFYFWLSQFFIF